MKLDISQVWSDASATVAANKEVLAVLGGIFFLLPSLAFALFFPQPEPPAGAEPKQLFAIMQEFYLAAAPYMLIIGLVQIVGQLAVLSLTGRSKRITVSEAIRDGVSGLLPYIGAQLLIVLAMAVAIGLVAGLAAVTQSKALAVAIGIVLVIGAIYVALRLVLMPAVIAIERKHNPVGVLTHSWELTRGNVGRILLYVILLVVVAAVASAIAGAVVGIILNLVAGVEGARIGGALISSTIGAILAIYFTASFAAMHRQLSGPDAGEVADTFL